MAATAGRQSLHANDLASRVMIFRVLRLLLCNLNKCPAVLSSLHFCDTKTDFANLFVEQLHILTSFLFSNCDCNVSILSGSSHSSSSGNNFRHLFLEILNLSEFNDLLDNRSIGDDYDRKFSKSSSYESENAKLFHRLETRSTSITIDDNFKSLNFSLQLYYIGLPE